MTKTLTSLACALMLVLSAGTASALTIGDDFYLGSADPGSPASAADEVAYINFLISMTAPSTTTAGGHTYTRSDNTCTELFGNGCATATVVGADSNNNAGNPSSPLGIDVTGWTYLLGKYGNVAHIWVVTDLSGVQTIPETTGSGGGLSHWSLYNPGGTVTVPDGGATLGLLGFVMLGVGYLRSRMN